MNIQSFIEELKRHLYRSKDDQKRASEILYPGFSLPRYHDNRPVFKQKLLYDYIGKHFSPYEIFTENYISIIGKNISFNFTVSEIFESDFHSHIPFLNLNIDLNELFNKEDNGSFEDMVEKIIKFTLEKARKENSFFNFIQACINSEIGNMREFFANNNENTDVVLSPEIICYIASMSKNFLGTKHLIDLFKEKKECEDLDKEVIKSLLASEDGNKINYAFEAMDRDMLFSIVAGNKKCKYIHTKINEEVSDLLKQTAHSITVTKFIK